MAASDNPAARNKLATQPRVIVAARLASRSKPSPLPVSAPGPAKPPASEAEAISRLLGSIPESRGLGKTCDQRGW